MVPLDAGRAKPSPQTSRQLRSATQSAARHARPSPQSPSSLRVSLSGRHRRCRACAAMQGSAEVTTDEKLSLIKKAYRALKAETERREADLAAERAGQQRERGLLVARVDELQRELHELKEAVRKAADDGDAARAARPLR